MTNQFYLGYVLGFISPALIILALSWRNDYKYHRKNGHTKAKSLKLTIRRAFW